MQGVQKSFKGFLSYYHQNRAANLAYAAGIFAISVLKMPSWDLNLSHIYIFNFYPLAPQEVDIRTTYCQISVGIFLVLLHSIHRCSVLSVLIDSSWEFIKSFEGMHKLRSLIFSGPFEKGKRNNQSSLSNIGNKVCLKPHEEK